MAKARLTAKFTNCAGIGLDLSVILGLIGHENRPRFEPVGHNEPGVIFRRFPLIIGEDC